MKIIIKGDYCSHCGEDSCEHSRPNDKAILDFFPIWQERTCSIKEFNNKFGQKEGLWESKGTNHSEIECNNSDCCSYKDKGHKHCRRRLEDKKFWCIDFKSLPELCEFFNEIGYCKVYIEDQDGCGLTINLN